MAEFALLFSKDLAERAHKGYKTVTRRFPWPKLRKVKPGDILIVKETFWQWGKHVESGHRSVHGRPTYSFQPVIKTEERRPTILWQEPPAHGGYRAINKEDLGYHQRPSIFMPWAYARTKGVITSVREEQLRDITAIDCLREGIRLRGNSTAAPFNAKHDFRCLWARINGDTGPKSWLENPTVLRLEWVDTHSVRT